MFEAWQPNLARRTRRSCTLSRTQWQHGLSSVSDFGDQLPCLQTTPYSSAAECDAQSRMSQVKSHLCADPTTHLEVGHECQHFLRLDGAEYPAVA